MASPAQLMLQYMCNSPSVSKALILGILYFSTAGRDTNAHGSWLKVFILFYFLFPWAYTATGGSKRTFNLKQMKLELYSQIQDKIIYRIT